VATTATTLPNIEKMIEASIRESVEAKAEEIIKKAQDDLEKTIKSSVDQMALKVLSYYSVEHNHQEIVIRVRKDFPIAT